MLDAGNPRQHLLGRPGDQVFDVFGRRAGEGDEDVGHRHVDLRLFLARRDQGGEEAEQKAISASSGVIRESWKVAAMRPEMPIFGAGEAASWLIAYLPDLS